MAKVFQIVAYEIDALEYNSCGADLVDDLWHCELSYAGPRTVCGVQLDGDDGIKAGPIKDGYVICSTCLSIIDDIKRIRKYKPNG